MPHRRSVLRVLFGLYLVVMGGLGGVLVERVRFDHRRTAVLARYQDAIRRQQSERMAFERRAQAETLHAETGQP